MIVRIIIDGYNLLHAWKEIAPKKVRYSEDARQELIKVLTWYSDASISPVTVILMAEQKEITRKMIKQLQKD